MKRSSETGAIGSLLGCCDELSSSCREPAHLGVAEALHEMVVDHPHRLHERIADRRAAEPEAALDERGAHPIRFAGPGGQVSQAAAVGLLRPARHEAPPESIERADVLHESEKLPRDSTGWPHPLSVA